MLTIYNSLTQKKERFVSIKPNQVRMYVCGPTVYGDIHLGNARPIIFFDVVKRYLQYKGYQVTYASNITDVDDKIIDRAKELNISEKELSEKYIKKYVDMSKKVGSMLPDLMPKATDYVNHMIQYIGELINQGDAYENESGVYFRVHRVSDYGILSKQNIEELNEGVRITLESDKEDPRDFSIWKKTEDGLSFDSPWKKGRPGWHTECAVMNHELFQGEIDIHGGGSDLKFPHHENEIAQTVVHDNHHLARYWMHVGRLDVNQEKMSKSIGNVRWVKDLVKHVDPLSFRLLIISHHYRQKINYNDELMTQFIKEYDKIERSLKKTFLAMSIENLANNGILQDYMDRFDALMDDDFNTPNVMTLIQELLKILNKNNHLEMKQSAFYTLEAMLSLLGVMPTIHLSDDMIESYKKWEIARVQKDYAKADELRIKLAEQGWI